MQSTISRSVGAPSAPPAGLEAPGPKTILLLSNTDRMPILHKELDRIGFYRHGVSANRGPLAAVGALGCSLVSLVVNPALAALSYNTIPVSYTHLTLPTNREV